ncbi:MAG: 2-succinyl-5-enolpyruvyl-6-hydroxy-3-cyclohexene-1-carboxylic-acid synthase [Lachnoclostridium sp.]|nr:2-succinyl-5-enolpyruvyl-6-hydroxy-3-cyclohexene-1-carboxylic-acid synthase [Lachnoclostridium sp.]
MVTTDKLNCNILAELLESHGIKRVVASPGSRNAPLLLALSSRQSITMSMVIDERSAAFIALGMIRESHQPVAIVCTSGTALLNYAPAVAEAFYEGLPLIVVSADRPLEWIDQDDSQTIRQPGALANFVKTTCDIPARIPERDDQWMAGRLINDALIIAMRGRKGPVHINIRIDAPLGNSIDTALPDFKVVKEAFAEKISIGEISPYAEAIASSPRVMIIAGFMQHSPVISRILGKMSERDNIVVLTETVANVTTSGNIIPAIDLVLRLLPEMDEAYRPDLVITIGGALISRKIKEFVRGCHNIRHWHIGRSEHLVDCFRHLSLTLNCDPVEVFGAIYDRIEMLTEAESDYCIRWKRLYDQALWSHKEYVERVRWSDMKAFDLTLGFLHKYTPSLHFSNGTPIRYSQLFGYLGFKDVHCNRGVSGIDGSTSTALGASVVHDGITVLLSGDMSFQYDLSALSSKLMSPRFKMVVIDNNGGGIFRFVKSTADIPGRERFFSSCMNLPLMKIAEAYNISYFEASDEAELLNALPQFMDEQERPALLAIHTPPEYSADILKRYFD